MTPYLIKRMLKLNVISGKHACVINVQQQTSSLIWAYHVIFFTLWHQVPLFICMMPCMYFDQIWGMKWSDQKFKIMIIFLWACNNLVVVIKHGLPVFCES